jgi:Na+/H+-dicarboxylate symporter
MLDGAEKTLDVPRPISRFALPLAVSTLKVSAPVHCLVAVYFVARLTGTVIPTSALLGLAAISLAVSFSVPGVPHGAILVTAPVLAAAGLPTQAVALLLAVDAIPNAFRSAANSTGNLVVAAVLGRKAAGDAGEASPETAPAAL